MTREDKQALLLLADRSVKRSKEERYKLAERVRRSVLGADHENLRFPEKLHRLASNEVLYPHVFWSDDGNALIVNRRGFERYVMGIFFDQSKLKSFQNNLSKYNFQSMSTPASELHSSDINSWEHMVYVHPFFQKKQESLCESIKRANKSKHKAESNVGKRLQGSMFCPPLEFEANANDPQKSVSLKSLDSDINIPLSPAPPLDPNRFPKIDSNHELDCESVSSSVEIEEQFNYEMLV